MVWLWAFFPVSVFVRVFPSRDTTVRCVVLAYPARRRSRWVARVICGRAARVFRLLSAVILHKQDEHEDVKDQHARHDESRSEPGGAKLRRDLQTNSAAEIQQQVTEPHEIE